MNAYFINAFMEVDESDDELTIKLLHTRGNCFTTRQEAISKLQEIKKILKR